MSYPDAQVKGTGEIWDVWLNVDRQLWDYWIEAIPGSTRLVAIVSLITLDVASKNNGKGPERRLRA